MVTKWIGLSSVACLFCVFLAACRVTPPAAIASPPADTAPGEAEDSKSEEEEGTYTAPSIWCGTGRMGGGRTMRDWQKPDAGGRWKRLFVRHAGSRWVLVTEWGEERDGRFETWEDVSALPRGPADKVGAHGILRLIDRLQDPEEEVVFRAALALGAQGAAEAVPHLAGLLKPRERTQEAIAAALALKQIGSLDAIYFLLEALHHHDALLHKAVLEALEGLTDHVISPPEKRPDDVPAQYEEPWRRESVRSGWRKWWRTNKDAVRRRANKAKSEKKEPDRKGPDEKK